MGSFDGDWYCPLIKNKINHVDCYEVIMSSAGFLKKEALFVKFDIDNWFEICNKCSNNLENQFDSEGL